MDETFIRVGARFREGQLELSTTEPTRAEEAGAVPRPSVEERRRGVGVSGLRRLAHTRRCLRLGVDVHAAVGLDLAQALCVLGGIQADRVKAVDRPRDRAANRYRGS